MRSLIERVQQTIKKYRMFSPGARIVVGVSGGPDSTTLLHLLFRLKSLYNLHLWGAYLDHQLREKEVEEEIAWVRRLTSKLKIPVIISSFNVPLLMKEEKLSLEEAARIARYKFLNEVAHKLKANIIAVGHTASDQIETLLLHLLRGSGMQGFCGIPPRRERIIRPLIEVFREEIIEYCREYGLRFCVDSSNKETMFLRNKIRLQLIPYLCQYNPQIKKSILKTIEILREENEYLEKETERIFKSLIEEENEEEIVLNDEEFSSYPVALQRRIIRKAIFQVKGNLRKIQFSHIDSFLKLEKEKGCKRISLPENLLLQRDYGKLSVRKKKDKEAGLSSRKLTIPGEIDLPEIGLKLRTEIIYRRPSSFPEGGEEVYLDLDKLKGPLVLRRRLKGDRFRPLGMNGSKKIKDFFIDLKIPREKRDKIPLLVNGERIVWVVGYCLDDHFKITKDTRKVLKIKVLKDGSC